MTESRNPQSGEKPQDLPLRPRETFEEDWKHRYLNWFPSGLAKLGFGPYQLLFTKGRKSGKTYAKPVTLIDHDGIQWLVAPYGETSWVHNARAAGRVEIRYGRSNNTYTIREVGPEEAGPVLKKYVTKAGVTEPYFWASPDSTAQEFEREAHLHPVFALTPAT